MIASVAPPPPLQPANDQSFADPTTARIAAFLHEIGIPVVRTELPDPCFMPGIRLDRGRILVDESRLLYPGDLLHEAGHIAVMTPERRQAREKDAGKNMGDEIVAITWSWAALTHLGLAPEVVFHPQGYRGSSEFFIFNYSSGNHLGLPLLQWMGLAFDAQRAAKEGVAPFPHMVRWLRE